MMAMLIVVGIVVALAAIGVSFRDLVERYFEVDLTHLMLALGPVVLALFFTFPTLFTVPPLECFTPQQDEYYRRVSGLVVAASNVLVFTGLGAATVRDGRFSTAVALLFLPAIWIFGGALVGVALGHPIMCAELR